MSETTELVLWPLQNVGELAAEYGEPWAVPLAEAIAARVAVEDAEGYRRGLPGLSFGRAWPSLAVLRAECDERRQRAADAGGILTEEWRCFETPGDEMGGRYLAVAGLWLAAAEVWTEAHAIWCRLADRDGGDR